HARQAVAGLRLGIAPMHGQSGAERVELEDQIRMTGGDQLVVHDFVVGPEVTLQALLGAQAYVPGVIHAEGEIVRVWIVDGGVGAKPFFRGSVTTLAGHAIGNGSRRGADGVARQAALRRLRRTQLEDLGHALGALVREDAVRLGVLVANGPYRVLVGQDAAVLLARGGGAAVAIRRGAATSADVLDGLGGGGEEGA